MGVTLHVVGHSRAGGVDRDPTRSQSSFQRRAKALRELRQKLAFRLLDLRQTASRPLAMGCSLYCPRTPLGRCRRDLFWVLEHLLPMENTP